MKPRIRTTLWKVDNVKIHFPEQTVRLELYRLACYFHASKPLRDMSDGSDWCPFQPLRDEFQRAEVMRILLYVAISARLLGDLLRDRGEKEYMETQEVGSLVPDLKHLKRIPLNLRECCNKIIHARQIVISQRGGGNPYRAYLAPRITLFSHDSRRVGWKAIIEVDRFVAEFSQLAT